MSDKRLHADYKPKWSLFSRSGYITSWKEYEAKNKQWWDCRAMTADRFQGEIITEITCRKGYPPFKDWNARLNELAEVRGHDLHLLDEIPEGADYMKRPY